MSYQQAGRPMRVETALDTDVLLLEGLSGVEGVSQPFSFRLDLLSEDDAVSAADLLRTPAAVTLVLPGGDERTIHGLIRRFVQEGRQEELTSYQAEIVPWLWFLSLSRESRIYQELSVLEIVEQVFRGLGHADFELRCSKSYPKREFCVQYRETHLDFVSRLLEEEGIFYFFEHSPERHLLVLADDNAAVKPCPGGERVRMAPQGADADDVVGMLHWEEQACVGKVVLRDYDFLQPSLKLEGAIAAREPEEVYDYPGEFTAPDEGERYARLRLEETGALRQVARGQSTCRAFRSGFRFDLEEHFRDAANQPYMLLQVQHVASAGDYRAGGDEPMEYRNHFVAIPHSVVFRPPRVTPPPLVQGSQTALVVGPAGEEVWVDRHGRIKVQFYWDRVGKKDENSSCWVRVAQPWAGKGWGAVQIPRIGNEVVVEFLEGDPDRPLVTGSVYNAEQTPPFDLPGAGIQMGMKSRSSKGGGGYNEITMTDTKGTEAMTVHAQHNHSTTVQNDKTVTVKSGNRTLTVESGTNSETIKGDATLTVQAGKRAVDVTGGDYSATSSDAVKLHGKGAGVLIKGDAAGVTIEGAGGPGVKITGSPDVDINGLAKAVLKGPAVTVNGTATCGVASPAVTIDGTSTVSIVSPSVDIGNNVITIHGSTIVLQAGGGSIVIDGSGVTITGSKITSMAGGPHMITGAIVMIN